MTRKSTEKILSKFGSRKSELALSQKLMGSNNRLQSQSSLHSGNSTTSLDSIASCRSESDFTVTHGSQFEASFRDSLDFIEITMSKEEGFINSFFKDTRSRKDRADMGEVVLCRYVPSKAQMIVLSQFFILINSRINHTTAVSTVALPLETDDVFGFSNFQHINISRSFSQPKIQTIPRFVAELESFINTSCKFDPYYALPIYLSILDRLDDTQQESFLFNVLRHCLDTSNLYFNEMHKVKTAAN